MHHKGERSQHSNQAASDHNQMGAVTLFATNPTVSTPAAHISVYYKSLIFIKSALALWVCRQGTTSASAHRVSEGRPQCFLFIDGKALSVCLHSAFSSRRRAAAHRTTCAWTLVTAASRRFLGISPARSLVTLFAIAKINSTT